MLLLTITNTTWIIIAVAALVVGLAVDALALCQGDVIVFLLKGKPNEELCNLEVVGVFLCLFEQGDA